MINDPERNSFENNFMNIDKFGERLKLTLIFYLRSVHKCQKKCYTFFFDIVRLYSDIRRQSNFDSPQTHGL